MPQVPNPDRSTRWLNEEERATWLALGRLFTKLPAALDAQLERSAGLNYFEYMVLAMLSEHPERRLRMSQLAAFANGSLSRLSHVVKRLEAAGFVRREPDELDGRTTKAVLTDAGLQAVLAAAPGHVSAVRELIFDPMTADQMRTLRTALEAILTSVDPSGMPDLWTEAAEG